MTDNQSDNFKMPLKRPFVVVVTLTALAILVGLIMNEYRRSKQFDEFKNRICSAEILDSSISEIEELLRYGPKNDEEMKTIVERVEFVFPPYLNVDLYFEWSDGLWRSRRWLTSKFNRNESLGKLGKWQDLIDDGQCVGKRTNEEFEIFLPINTTEGKAGVVVRKTIEG
jgi:hypothetical protein